MSENNGCYIKGCRGILFAVQLCQEHYQQYMGYFGHMSEYKKTNNPTEELLKQRGSVYGDVKDNMNCFAAFAAVWEKFNQGNLKFNDEYERIAHAGCIGMVLHKLARICTGYYNVDNYKDVAGYIELARKIAAGEPTKVDTA